MLSRFVPALDARPADAVIPLTADCPLLDPTLIDAVAGAWAADPSHDYVSTVLVRCLPRGLDDMLVTASALRAWTVLRSVTTACMSPPFSTPSPAPTACWAGSHALRERPTGNPGHLGGSCPLACTGDRAARQAACLQRGRRDSECSPGPCGDQLWGRTEAP